MWYRIFSRVDTPVSPAALVAHLHEQNLPVVPHFKGDDLGWTTGELHLPNGSTPIMLERYLTEEDDLRPQLNTFAAELETMDYSPNHVPLMQRVIETRQMVTFRRPLDHADEVTLDRLCLAICRYLASNSEGIYQIDQIGWHDADSTLLLQEY